MTKLSDAADRLLAMAEQQQALVDVANAVREIGRLDQAIQERRDGYAKATQEHEAKLAEVENATAKLSALNAGHEAAITAHEASIAQSADVARNEAESIVRKAQAEAAEMIEIAKRDVASIQDGDKDRHVAAEQELAELRDEAASVQADIDAKRAEHAQLTEEIAGLRLHAKKIAG